jgi:hypothetical protein
MVLVHSYATWHAAFVVTLPLPSDPAFAAIILGGTGFVLKQPRFAARAISRPVAHGVEPRAAIHTGSVNSIVSRLVSTVLALSAQICRIPKEKSAWARVTKRNVGILLDVLVSWPVHMLVHASTTERARSVLAHPLGASQTIMTRYVERIALVLVRSLCTKGTCE